MPNANDVDSTWNPSVENQVLLKRFSHREPSNSVERLATKSSRAADVRMRGQQAKALIVRTAGIATRATGCVARSNSLLVLRGLRQLSERPRSAGASAVSLPVP